VASDIIITLKEADVKLEIDGLIDCWNNCNRNLVFAAAAAAAGEHGKSKSNSSSSSSLTSLRSTTVHVPLYQYMHCIS